jgi:hypothetical protein
VFCPINIYKNNNTKYGISWDFVKAGKREIPLLNIITLTWNLTVVRTCLPSGLHNADTRPSDPWSILHRQSGCSREKICSSECEKMQHIRKSESGDQLNSCKEYEI